MADSYEGESERAMAEFQLVRGQGSVPIKPKTEAEMQPRILDPHWQPGMKLEELEKRAILKAFRVYGSQVATADALGISVRTVHNKLVKYGQQGLEDVGTVISGESSEGGRGTSDMRAEKDLGAQAGQTASVQTEDGVHVQPATEVAAQRTVSMRERDEVQKVLPHETSRPNSGKRR